MVDYSLSKVFNNATGQTLEFFLNHADKDYSMSEIRKETDLSPRSLIRIIPRLVSLDIISITRTVGSKIKMYQLVNNKITNALITFNQELKLQSVKK
jgi:predicted DNA-binding protein YlxM (UPF0122 family)